MSKSTNRCPWCGNDDIYVKYHDDEWGKKVRDDKTLFEFLVLESAQAGLSWITILKRREGYRRLFANFDVDKVANFTQDDIDRIVQDPAIIRHRGKIASTVTNAQIFKQIQSEYGSFYNYLYSFMPDGQSINNSLKDLSDGQATSKESDSIAKDLKKRGVKFFGSTICYAYMQAVGMVNDHLTSCDYK
ncbi:DNA-3-methyladenine glycosylase I [Sphingobacterium rhinopitheci]|uniref:DNA-3-methyladenine glycosylase I n=1 Tax=Sphingobacterium rhinopitheci TaxID=2781960 RepID=UPI001F525B48|nr:DNA-3-methyladenine glycosylase I [Sphingobacterium rhinopitheci]MCI0920437.1 DNA-3-methyladenine glycosylase I [Sphingobacterium rhinopitheci]